MVIITKLKNNFIKYCLVVFIITTSSLADIKPVDIISAGNSFSTVGNLLCYFDIFKCDTSDAKEKKHHKKIMKKIVRENYPNITKSDELFWSVHAIRGHTNIIFFSALNPNITSMYSFNIAYNKELDKHFFLKNMTINSINELLGTENFDFRCDTDYLKYAYLVATLKNSPFRVKMIANLADLFLESRMKQSFSYNLEDFEKYENIEIGLPQILIKNDEANITFYLARKSVGLKISDIVKIDIVLMKGEVIDYQQKQVIADCFMW